MDDVTRPNGIRENANAASVRPDSPDDIISLADYLHVISKHRRMIFWICAVTVIVTAVVSLFLPKRFAAVTSVVPAVDALKDGGMGSGLGAVKSDILRKAMDVTSIADMYVGILRSRSIADTLIERFDLRKVYRIDNSDSAVRQILGDRTAIKVTEEGILVITVEDGDPCRAAALANSYVEELDRQNKRLFVGRAASKKVFLENRLKEIEQELSRIDNLLSRDAKTKEMLFELLTREYEIAKIEEAKSMPTIQVLDRAVIPEKKCKPKRTQMVFLAGITSLFVGVVVVLGRECLLSSRSKGT